LLLCAQGYSAEQVATLLRTSPEKSEELVAEAVQAMGTKDLDSAVKEGRRRGLI
jgi:hypothetical protein